MATDELFHTVATYKLSTLHRSLDRDEESSRVLEEFLCHVRRLDWRVGRIRSDLGSKYVTKLQPPQRNDATIFEMVKSEFEKFELAMDGSKINGIVERFHHTVDEMANAFYHGNDPKFFFWKYVYRHLNWIY